MRLDKRFILLFLTIVLLLPVRAQSYNTQQIELAERLHSLASNTPPELAYIQTSKDIYETGENLWFKVYLLDAQYLVPSLLSKTLYLQLLNENTRKIVWEEKYEIQNGFADGRVYLESTLPEGNYFLAAYTPNSIINDTTEFKAIRRIKIVTDITSQTSGAAKSVNPSLINSVPEKENSIQFNTFPEGGDLVSGIQSRLAFKAVNSIGQPIDIKGTLFEDNVLLIEFSSRHAGMGSFYFTPNKNKQYFIRLTQPAIDTTFLLPEISTEGMTMTLIDRNKESLSFKISKSTGLSQSDFYIRVQCRGVVYGMTAGKISDEIMMKIPLLLLPQGIAEVTLFNGNLDPVAERLVYINKDKKLNITAELSSKTFSQRGKATLKIHVKDEHGQPVMANLGVTVFDKLYQNPLDSNNILSHVYLSSQLKGRIYNPSYYFNNASKNCEESLDLLMLTQGWRKYVWTEANLNKLNKESQQIIFDGILGSLYNPESKRNKIPKEQSFVMAFSPNIDSSNVIIPADPEGVFTVSADKLRKWENDYVYLKPMGSKGSNLKIKLNDPFETINQIMSYNEFSIPLKLVKEKKEISDTSYSAGSDVVKIKEVTVKGEKGNIIRGKYMGMLDSLAKFNSPYTSDYVCRYNVLNCPIHPNEKDNRKPVEGEIYYTSKDPLRGITDGTVTYHYKPQKFTEEELLKLNNLYRVKAYYGNREFYQPNYDKDNTDGIIPDFRNSLLWAPSVFTSTKGEATLTFFCSDINTDFIGRIEGVGGDGLLGTGYFKFTVRKMKPTP
jgi:hypothetical protein